jgi:hypothetical protein
MINYIASLIFPLIILTFNLKTGKIPNVIIIIFLCWFCKLIVGITTIKRNSINWLKLS